MRNHHRNIRSSSIRREYDYNAIAQPKRRETSDVPRQQEHEKPIEPPARRLSTATGSTPTGIAAAACLFDRNRDRIVCIYEGEPDAAALARAMRRLVPKYMLPNIYEKLDTLPMNANGKIDRVKLKEQFIHAED